MLADGKNWANLENKFLALTASSFIFFRNVFWNTLQRVNFLMFYSDNVNIKWLLVSSHMYCTLYPSSSQCKAGWPDGFLQNSPKYSPTHVLSKLIQNSNCWKIAQNEWYLCNFQKTTYNANNLPIGEKSPYLVTQIRVTRLSEFSPKVWL
jgi:hypothetical protein